MNNLIICRWRCRWISGWRRRKCGSYWRSRSCSTTTTSPSSCWTIWSRCMSNSSKTYTPTSTQFVSFLWKRSNSCSHGPKYSRSWRREPKLRSRISGRRCEGQASTYKISSKSKRLPNKRRNKLGKTTRSTWRRKGRTMPTRQNSSKPNRETWRSRCNCRSWSQWKGIWSKFTRIFTRHRKNNNLIIKR